MISIHAPPRGATAADSVRKTSQGISIHAPPRGATPLLVTETRNREKFQFTPLREGRRYSGSGRTTCCNFNSRPSARGDGGCTRNHLFQGISIHAPPRGATCQALFNYPEILFQFTPLREGRPHSSLHCVMPFYFNSRPSARGDPVPAPAPAPVKISIHAPPRGATVNQGNVLGIICISIHAPPRGATCANKLDRRRNR